MKDFLMKNHILTLILALLTRNAVAGSEYYTCLHFDKVAFGESVAKVTVDISAIINDEMTAKTRVEPQLELDLNTNGDHFFAKTVVNPGQRTSGDRAQGLVVTYKVQFIHGEVKTLGPFNMHVHHQHLCNSGSGGGCSSAEVAAFVAQIHFNENDCASSYTDELQIGSGG